MVDSLKEAADAMQSLKDLKIPPVTVEMEPIPAMLPAAMPAAQLTPFEGLGGIFSQEFEKVKGQVTSWLAGLPGQVRAVVAQLPGILAGMWGQAKAQSPFLAGITEDFEKVKTWLTINWPLIQAIVMTAGVVISSVIGAVRDVFVNDVSPKLVEAFDKLKKAIGDLGITWPDVWNAIKRAVGIVAVIIGAIILGLVGIIVGIVNGIALVLEFVTSRIELFKGAWNETFAGIGTFFIGLWDTIRSILTGDWPAAWENLKLMLSGAWTFFKGLLLLIYLTVTSIFGTILAFLLGFVEGFVNFFKNLYDRLVGKESSTIPVMLQGIYETITTKITEVITWLGTQVQAFLDAGKNLIGGFIQGISSKWQDLKAWFRGKFSEIPEWARKIFGIGSPSKLFQYYGEMIQKGLLVGMDSGGVESAMRSMVPNVSGAGTGQQIVVVQIPSLALPGIRDGRDADGLIAQLLSDTFEHAALKSLVPGGIG
jgi:phage-related protein